MAFSAVKNAIIFTVSFLLSIVETLNVRSIIVKPFNMLRRGPIHPSRKETVCIVGGGFGGLYTALSVRKKLNVQDDVYLIDKRDSFVFLPLLYELSLGTAVDTEVAPLFSM